MIARTQYVYSVQYYTVCSYRYLPFFNVHVEL